MASADLDHIRALLIAQTEAPEPQTRGLLGRLRLGRRERREPLTLGPVAASPRFTAPAPCDPDQDLLLKALCGPAPETGVLGIETASPLPPPTPRNGFGRRADGTAETELMLETPATAPRRLRVLDDRGGAVGEIILLPEEPPLRTVYGVADEAHAAPYFPEDLMEPEAPQEPQPLRPWIKALRGAGAVKPSPADLAKPESMDDQAPLVKRVRQRRATKAAPRPPAPLGHDLLEALALTLAREHDTLADRLLAVASEQLFRQGIMAGAVAA